MKKLALMFALLVFGFGFGSVAAFAHDPHAILQCRADSPTSRANGMTAEAFAAEVQKFRQQGYVKPYRFGGDEVLAEDTGYNDGVEFADLDPHTVEPGVIGLMLDATHGVFVQASDGSPGCLNTFMLRVPLQEQPAPSPQAVAPPVVQEAPPQATAPPPEEVPPPEVAPVTWRQFSRPPVVVQTVPIVEPCLGRMVFDYRLGGMVCVPLIYGGYMGNDWGSIGFGLEAGVGIGFGGGYGGGFSGGRGYGGGSRGSNTTVIVNSSNTNTAYGGRGGNGYGGSSSSSSTSSGGGHGRPISGSGGASTCSDCFGTPNPPHSVDGQQMYSSRQNRGGTGYSGTSSTASYQPQARTSRQASMSPQTYQRGTSQVTGTRQRSTGRQSAGRSSGGGFLRSMGRMGSGGGRSFGGAMSRGSFGGGRGGRR